MKTIVLLLLLCTARVLGQQSQIISPSRPLIIAASTVGTVRANHGSYTVVGSCVAISANIVMTATHVVRTSARQDITCAIEGHTFHPLVVVAEPTSDMTMMIVPRGMLLHWSEMMPRATLPIGITITVIGFTQNHLDPEFMTGRLEDTSESHFLHLKKNGLERMVISQVVLPGMSGGGAFTSDGRLVGMIVSQLQSLNPAVKSRGVILPIWQPLSK